MSTSNLAEGFVLRRLNTWLMRHIRTSHTRHVSIYLMGNVAAAMIPFFLVPFLTQHLSPTAYGSYSLFQMAMTAALPLVTWMCSSIVIREYALREKERFARFFTICLALCVTITLSVVLLANVLNTEHIIPLPRHWLIAAVFCALIQGYLTLMQNIASMQKRPWLYLKWRLGPMILLGAGLVLVVSHEAAWQMMASTQLLLSVFFMITIVCYTFKQGLIRRPAQEEARKDLRLILYYSAPLVIHSLSSTFILQNADRLFVSRYLGLAEAGVYNVAQQLSLALFVITNSLNQVWQPWFHEQMKNDSPETRQRIVRIGYLGFGLLLILGILAYGFILLAFPYLIGAEFQTAQYLLPWLMLGGVMNGMYIIVASPLFFFGDTKQLMLCNIGTGLLSLLLNFFLVKQFGLYGAVFATLFSTCFMLFSVWWVSAKRHPYPWLSRNRANAL